MISSPKHEILTRGYSPFTFVLSENVFCQSTVVLLSPVCVLISGMLHVYKSDVGVAVFETSINQSINQLITLFTHGIISLKSGLLKSRAR